MLAFAHVKDVRLNANEILLNVIQKRFNSKTKYLDLSNFHRDPGMMAQIFCCIYAYRDMCVCESMKVEICPYSVHIASHSCMRVTL
jgi:hypothetical protein